jgi:two-component system phosphate regulon sensor histidine kinase PhoR
MPTPLRVLIIEDSENDALLLIRELRRGGFDPTFTRVDTPQAMRLALDQQMWALVICDYAMPHFNGLDALKLYQETGLDIPFVIVSGTIGEDIAVNTMRAGAHDYIMKERLSRLVPAVQRELREAQERQARKQAEDALRANEVKYRTLFEASTDAIFLETMDGRVLDCNDRACQLHGYTKDEMLLLKADDLILREVLDTVIEDMHMQLGVTGTAFLEAAGKRKDGSFFPTEVNIQLTTVDNEPLAVIYVRDITERKRSEEALQKYRDHLEDLVRQRTTDLKTANEHLMELSRIKDKFVSNVSHELRTPITSLKLHQYLLVADADKFDEHLAVIRRETDRLAHIIDALLHLSRLDQGRAPFDPVPIDLNTLAAQYVSDRAPLAERKGLRLLFDGSIISPVVMADERLLGQALSILLTNALNYTPSGGRITVRTETRFTDGHTWGALIVSDTGPGIAPEEHPRLFERFFRGKVGLESGTPGTGLGLALAKEIVQLHQGRIRVMSEGTPGDGATVIMELPIQP